MIISNKQYLEFEKRLCPHRGTGGENTLEALESAISMNPYMVEFDIQYADGHLYLGHPPNVNRDLGLIEALNLFEDTTTIAKIDLRMRRVDHLEALNLLVNSLRRKCKANVLINLGSDDMNGAECMEAENVFQTLSNNDLRLNVDLNRYLRFIDMDQDLIEKHISKSAPFSLSPNLNTDIDNALLVAKQFKINNVHFWSNENDSYAIEDLIRLMDKAISQGFDVYFDIRPENIVR